MVRIVACKSFGEARDGNGVSYFEYAGKSSDTKPTAGVATGSIFVEVNTGKVFFFSEPSTWTEQFSFQG